MVMKDGQILEAGPVDTVLSSPQHDYTRTLVSQAGV
jgi:ABC-type microcin C transport system duplicated ATPase subunit YejF